MAPAAMVASDGITIPDLAAVKPSFIGAVAVIRIVIVQNLHVNSVVGYLLHKKCHATKLIYNEILLQ